MKIPNWIKKKKIAVIYGGWSEEKNISLKTGQAVLRALKSLGLNAVGIEADLFLAQNLTRKKITYCFIALHGKFGEDGAAQGLCEMLRIPYAGSTVLASALAMNKAASKRIFAACGIPTAPFFVTENARETRLKLPLPVVVKPVDGGSAIGVSIVRRAKEFAPALKSALGYSSAALVEKFIAGTEITAPVLGSQVLPLIQIVPKNAFYDFRAKYVKGMSKHILPAPISKKLEQQIARIALDAHRALGCKAFSRVDFIVDEKQRPWVLEVNTIPGMTETSLFPESAKAAGLSFPEMLLAMITHSVS